MPNKNLGIDLWVSGDRTDHYKKQNASYRATGSPVVITGTVNIEHKTVTFPQRSVALNIYNNSSNNLFFDFDGSTSNFSKLLAFSAVSGPWVVDSLVVSGSAVGTDHVITITR